MANTSSLHFYSSLDLHSGSISDLVANKALFSKIPEDWYALAADIKNSTEAVRTGKHDQINLVATGTVIAILNLAYSKNITIPFFFGGDGATMLIPNELLQSAMAALNQHRINTKENFGLELKIGALPIKDIYSKGISLELLKVKISEILTIPVVLGEGLQYAENKIKARYSSSDNVDNKIPDLLDLEGMECKWDKISPPNSNQEVVSLIVTASKNTDPSEVFSKVLHSIDTIYGSLDRRKPISVKRLNLKASLRKLNEEMRTKLGKYDLFYLIKNWYTTVIGKYYWSNTLAGKTYLQKLVELTDTLTIDGRINTVITGTPQQRKSLASYLDNLEEKGKIKYGLHVSEQSVMSCYVRDFKIDDHIHFVDGAGGGYTKAANQLKNK
ncbi:DUF3095 family protein [Gillisia sp. Hel_I_29]|uniref:DUF3095 family protein n=1 Tax=Gillisia sp. Hel_I_29 TaxID=1249975 RepID=UPI0005518CAF|nr:DUF3095 family protein [Gillisia sp. Hel_I_29]